MRTESLILPQRLLLLSLIAGLGFASAGCRVVQKAEFKPGSQSIQKHLLRVALVLDDNLCKLQRDRPEGYVYPLGEYLCPCARHIAQQSFARVTEYDSLPAAMKCPDADAVLVPKFVKLEIRARGVAWEKRHALVVLEWTLKNIKDEKTIWLATAEGRAEGTVGSGFTMDKKDRIAMQEALDDLYKNSADAFNQSEEIRAFAQSLARQ